jgi:hypothetical protein
MDKKIFDDKYGFDYDSFFSMIKDIGPTLNERKNRFDKADLIEAGCQAATEDRLTWVDEQGWDLEDKDTGVRFEVKSQGNCLSTPTQKLKKGMTSKVKLTNTLQQGDDKKLEATADWLILIDTKAPYAMGIISYREVVDRWSFQLSDGFGCQIPMENVEVLCNPMNPMINESDSDETYAVAKRKLQSTYVKSFFKG